MPAWSTPSSGRTAALGHFTSSPKTKKSWLNAGASAKATAKPWPTRKWHGRYATTAARARSWKCAANSPTSLTRWSCRDWRPWAHLFPQHKSSFLTTKSLLNRATTVHLELTGTTGMHSALTLQSTTSHLHWRQQKAWKHTIRLRDEKTVRCFCSWHWKPACKLRALKATQLTWLQRVL